MMVDKKKLNAAFAMMRKCGLLARHRWNHDMETSEESMHKEVQEMADGSGVPIGYCFTLARDDYRLRTDRTLMVSFGQNGVDSGDDKTAIVGNIVLQCFRAAGVPVRWNGKPETKIQILPE